MGNLIFVFTGKRSGTIHYSGTFFIRNRITARRLLNFSYRRHTTGLLIYKFVSLILLTLLFADGRLIHPFVTHIMFSKLPKIFAFGMVL